MLTTSTEKSTALRELNENKNKIALKISVYFAFNILSSLLIKMMAKFSFYDVVSKRWLLSVKICRTINKVGPYGLKR